MAVKEKQVDHTEEIEWNVDNEIQLFFAMNGHKPVGINKYFHMVCIWEKFRAAIHKDISLKVVWSHLESMYDLAALDDMEDLPFPSNETDFALPESEFSSLMKLRKKEELDVKSKEVQPKEKQKEMRKDKDSKDIVKKDIPPPKEVKGSKEPDRKKEEPKKPTREMDMKKDKLRDSKDIKKEQHKSSKGRPKGKDDDETASAGKKERKDSESSRDGPKRGVKRPTRQSVDNTSKASSSPRDTPPPKRRRI
ncbi:MRG/MORF4L-binding protein isoform X1 [Neodiprion pinetum]|uniref:MRG/MORF4L-binding protein n=2 Tax=Neodiprion lecontei TaxID=441921 RepID=A0A6J0C7J2_NEOLC|nr:MRG/MORF4L-binding protein isoform X1 [Neodiprion lecontei]XP_046471241.1 MRG/MORF4L-binding protein isoform X1 [Neodiprion pinetum]XP_046471243.1 MRG/MORF4L-binding protein isoform X1 [Neodiprion pinetum]XP_046471244.1 MRG/MORF4L-binding protein isoform X1 [Neodiprion pinetum]XP_046590794.1 MRG/MORF4L-binding protein isoform X1 [Neodiprion lecontei]